MAKELVLAVAGSGKTTKILASVAAEKRSLIVTYTNENLRSLEAALRNDTGAVPKNITLLSYFSFLYTFCFRPFFSYELRDRGLFWDVPGTFPTKGDIRHYLTKNGYLYGNRLAKFVIEHGGVPKIIARLEAYFDQFLIDEVQDFAANDFNFLMEISRAELDISLVGDFYQHTFDTSRDGNIRANLHKRGIDPYIEEFKAKGFAIDTSSLAKTHRCSPSVCEFISDKIDIKIESNRIDDTSIYVIEGEEESRQLFDDDKKVKLFFQDHDKYPCLSNNWGKCKGLNGYGDVCVILNKKTAELFRKSDLRSLPDSTKNKLYVACSRANGSLYILFEENLKQFKK